MLLMTFISIIQLPYCHLALVIKLFLMNSRINGNSGYEIRTPLRRNNDMFKSQFLTNSVRHTVDPETVIHTFFRDHPVLIFPLSGKSSEKTKLVLGLSPTNLPTGQLHPETMWLLMKRSPTERPSVHRNSKASGTENPSLAKWSPTA
jgi:hypothetical protein